MAFQFRFSSAAGSPEDELNTFLRSHRVIAVHRQFVGQEGNACWCFAVEHLIIYRFESMQILPIDFGLIKYSNNSNG